jgi:hypothetical protein
MDDTTAYESARAFLPPVWWRDGHGVRGWRSLWGDTDDSGEFLVLPTFEDGRPTTFAVHHKPPGSTTWEVLGSNLLFEEAKRLAERAAG